MTRDETKKILMNIECSYPNWKPQGDIGFMVDIWADDLAEYSYQEIYMALKSYKATNTSGFAPNVGQLIAELQKFNPAVEKITDAQAWAMVRKALENGNYHSTEEFEKLPELVQKAVGSADQLRIWAGDPDYNESVISSNFKRAYRTIIERAETEARLPIELRNRIGGIVSEQLIRLQDNKKDS